MKLALYSKNNEILQKKSFLEMAEALKAFGAELYTIDCCDMLSPDTDMLLSIGGDGTFLSAATLVKDKGIPILGVNFGRLGFLSEYRPEDIAEALQKKEYEIEDRALLHVQSNKDTSTWPYALNEVSFHRIGAAMLGVDVALDGECLPTYWADGLLVATGSGSTAYSLSAGGPICTPDTQVLIISPIAPHNLNVRPLVVPSSSKVKLSLRAREKEAMLTMDNRDIIVSSDIELSIEMAQFSLKRVRLGKSNFFQALRTKLFWGEDVRNETYNK